MAAQAMHRLRAAWQQPEARWLAAVLLLAAVLRIVWVIYAEREPQGLHDPTLYYAYGQGIANGFGYALPDGATAYYPVGYPATLAALYYVIGQTPVPDNLTLATGLFQAALGVATVALVYYVARRLFTPAVGLLAALWLALFPNLIFHTATFLTETVFLFLLLSAVAVLLSARWDPGRPDWPRLLGFAVLLGLSALVRPISLLLLGVLPVAWLIAGYGWRRAGGYTAVMAVTAAAVIAPWTVRNIVRMDAPVIISTNLGDDLCMGHYEGAPGHFTLPERCFAEEDYVGLDRPAFEVERNNDNMRKAISFAVHNPRAELKLLLRKAYHLWRHDHDGLWAVESYGADRFIDGGLRGVLMRTADGYFFVTISLGGLGLAGFVLAASPSGALRPAGRGVASARRAFVLLTLLAMAGVPLIFFGDARFHVPALPFVSIAAAWLVVTAVGAMPGQRRSGLVEVADAELAASEQDALEDAETDEERDQGAAPLTDER